MTANNKIAFIRLRDWPLANVRVKEIVINEFSEFEVDTINVGALIKRHPFIIFVNILQIILYYGKDVLLGHKKIRAAFWHTPIHGRRMAWSSGTTVRSYSSAVRAQALSH